MAERPILVKATHAYAPVNNDELRLEKGEILTVTRKEDGGWWEGTLSNGKTGWFPSNYVENIVLIMSSSSSTSPLSSLSAVGPMDNNPQHHQQQDVATTTLPSSPQGSIGAGLNVSISNGTNGEPSTAFAAQQAEYRQIAFKELIESEMGHVQELQTFWEVYLAPLQKSEILKPGEFKTIVGNILEVTNMHLNLILNPLRSEQNKAAKDQRIGNIFLENATKFEEIHKAWGSNHPRAVQTVEKYKEQLSIFIESKGGRKPGILYIITLLSQPFRRLEKYPMLLQEIERHVEEFHKDRGDLQRSIEYYKDVQKTCSALRKQKEMELEVLSGSGIKDWEGSDVSQLGDIIFMNLVHLGNERHPRYLVLFPNTLLILSYSTETNSLVYEGKVPVSGITLRPLADKDALVNAFEIAGPMIDQITVGCASKAIRETWLAHLNSILKTNRFPSFSSSPQQVQFSRSLPQSIDFNDRIFLTSGDEKQELPKCSLTTSSSLPISSQVPEYKYTPSKNPPYVELCSYFQTLYKQGLIHSKSFECMQTLELQYDNIDLECQRRVKPHSSCPKYTPLSHVTSLDSSKIKKRQHLLVPSQSIFEPSSPSFKFSFCSDFDSDDTNSESTIRDSNCSTATSSSSPSEYRLTKEVGYPFHKWRWGMSNLCVEKLRSPSMFLSPSIHGGGAGNSLAGIGTGRNGGCGAPPGMIERSPGELHLDKSRSITFGDTKLYWKIKGTFSSFMSRSQSLPVIKLAFSEHKDTFSLVEQSSMAAKPAFPPTEILNNAEQPQSTTCEISSTRTKGRLVRQNAFDFDDAEVENLPDLNDNLQQIVNHTASSFDSGLGDLTPSNRTTQTNFYEEVTFEIASPPLNYTEGELPLSNISRNSPSGSAGHNNDTLHQASPPDLYRSGFYAHWLLKFESSFK